MPEMLLKSDEDLFCFASKLGDPFGQVALSRQVWMFLPTIPGIIGPSHAHCLNIRASHGNGLEDSIFSGESSGHGNIGRVGELLKGANKRLG
jgi:hypothetical protein